MWFVRSAILMVLVGRALAQETMPAIVVELKFIKDKIEFVSKTEKEAFVPKQYGVPQMAHIFFEAQGGKDGDVIYADELHDPREVRIDTGKADPDGEGDAGGEVKIEEATTTIVIPNSGQLRPKELVVYKRTSENSENGRTVLLRVGL